MTKRMIVRTLVAAAAALVFWGCATGNSKAPSQNPTTGQHPAGWVAAPGTGGVAGGGQHWMAYLKNPASCTPCHGSTTDAATSGGISQVSCFGCHYQGGVYHPEGPAHPTGFGDPAQHGLAHAMGVANLADPLALSGMQSCQTCHGSDYNTPVGFAPSCLACHTKAPHPNAPWGATNPPPPLGSPRHDQTDQSNAPVCFTCHAAGSSHNPINPPTPAPAGTVPGCFNNTMCHGTSF